ncbi:MAG: YHS domain-containing protein [Planctomycetes bacterium]|nr:YHS domain-containing protein [Planctomycetota bacterium]
MLGGSPLKTLRLLSLAALLFAAGCASTQRHDGPTAECPVCVCNHDEECRVVDIKTDTPQTEWDGRTWYFCSDECREAFRKEPEKYAKRAGR